MLVSLTPSPRRLRHNPNNGTLPDLIGQGEFHIRKKEIMKKLFGLLVIPVAIVGLAIPASARMPSYAYTVVAQGRCDWLRPLIARAGLPSVFVYIAARESGCARNGVYVHNRTDLSTSRFGLNFRGSMPRYWKAVCGVSNWTALRNVSLDLKCTAAAYHRNGLYPWR